MTMCVLADPDADETIVRGPCVGICEDVVPLLVLRFWLGCTAWLRKLIKVRRVCYLLSKRKIRKRRMHSRVILIAITSAIFLLTEKN